MEEFFRPAGHDSGRIKTRLLPLGFIVQSGDRAWDAGNGGCIGGLLSQWTYKYFWSSGSFSNQAAPITADVVRPRYLATAAPGYPIFPTANWQNKRLPLDTFLCRLGNRKSDSNNLPGMAPVVEKGNPPDPYPS